MATLWKNKHVPFWWSVSNAVSARWHSTTCSQIFPYLIILAIASFSQNTLKCSVPTFIPSLHKGIKNGGICVVHYCDSIPTHSVKVSKPLLPTWLKITGGEGMLRYWLTSLKCIAVNKVLKAKSQTNTFLCFSHWEIHATGILIRQVYLNSDFPVTSLTKQTKSHGLLNKYEIYNIYN